MQKRSRPPVSELSELYEQYAPALRLFLGRQLRVQHKADDLLHNIFECLLRYPPTERLVKAENYIWRIAWRLVNAANRGVEEHRERMAKLAAEADDWMLGQSSTSTPGDMSEWMAYQEKVKEYLELLTPEERKAVMMARFGYRYEEIAAHMDISVASLRRHLRQGYLKLQTFVSDTEKE
jgi:RNA polymerase sigma-70 factor (ECF subfamily)